MKEWLARYGGWLALVIAAAIYYPQFGKGYDGIKLYAEAAQCVLHSRPLRDCVPIFPYQPALAALIIPFALIPTALHKLVWYTICVGSLVITVRLSESMAGRLYPEATRGQNLIWLRVVGLVLCSKHILDVLNYQAYEAPALALIVFGIWALTTGRHALGGFGLAMAAAIRATPLIFLPYLILKRRYLACTVFVVGFVAVSLLPDVASMIHGGRTGFLSDWIQQVANPALTPGGSSNRSFWEIWNGNNLNNQSLRGLLNRFVQAPVFGLGPSSLLLAVYAAFGLVLAALLMISPREKEYAAIDGAVLLIAMLALSPMTSRYHFIFVLPAYILVVAAVIGDTRMRVFGSIVLAVSFMLLTGTSNDLAGKWLAEVAYLYGFMIEGAVALFVAFAAMLRVWRPPGMMASARGQ
jgi:alpha-1,2-mannosyltransferase